MSRTRSLRLALALAEREREQARQVLAQIQRAELHAMSQMDQLRRYAVETEGRWTRQAQQVATPELMRHHYQFMERLYQAIRLQEDVLIQCAQHVQHARQTLLSVDLRAMRLNKVIAGREREARQIASRREQRVMDQLAASMVQMRAIQQAPAVGDQS